MILQEKMKIILVTGSSLVGDDVIRSIKESGFSVRLSRQDYFTDEELHHLLEGASGYLIGGYEEPSSEHFTKATSLEAVAFVGTDYESYVPGWRQAFDLGIAVANCPGANATSVAEFSMLLMLMMARPFFSRISPFRGPATPLSIPGKELAGRTLGILGMGRIGRRLAHMASAMDMRVIYHSREEKEGVPFTFVPPEELFRSCDFISLHRPGPAKGEPPAISYAELEAMQPGTVLINAAHRDLIDPVALLQHIGSARVRAAFDGIGEGEAWEALAAFGPDRFLALPQMGFHTAQANDRTARMAAEAVCAVLLGGSSELVRNPGFRDARRR